MPSTSSNLRTESYLTQWPNMPRGEDVFTKMFNTDLSKDAIGALHSSGKPMGVCLYGSASTMMRIKQNIHFPLFDSPEEIVNSLKAQKNKSNLTGIEIPKESSSSHSFKDSQNRYEIQLLSGRYVYADSVIVTKDMVTFENKKGLVVSVNRSEIKSLKRLD